MILDTVTENSGVQVEFYNRFQYTVEVSKHLYDTQEKSDQNETLKMHVNWLVQP